ncbi:CCR4-NOT core subunit CDC39 KNAG_0I02650 [Huiozyma naganishii CBS 8797]|uniref:General negative regulator of transcription subunit 1 n=1 Tax=Huiozyma naganishii (strain ATCC MYA-139 / BCRC 22969 / CBS 8797 / KCTC 17520 / NBRC 10181 / NCYC 3082 / Yp74L-3) TaxID=1071383 RepID=J7RB04_HUIN7|nr:hypothetical protein KNAG_0I02650 [Kazachstania naganishii CBS 8797]CCK72050.1 hypothetical protein KNAG_0I02650 [Kazachstania naganishii CBS 8797]
MHLAQINHEYNLKREKEAAQIVLSQISLLITQLSNDNFNHVSKQIDFILDKSLPAVRIKYWKKLLTLCCADIKKTHVLDHETNLIHRLFSNLLKNLPFCSPEFINSLKESIFKTEELESQFNLTDQDIQLTLDNLTVPNLKEVLYPNIILDKLKQLTKMNNHNILQSLLSNSSPDNFASRLQDMLGTLSGEGLNDMVALLLSEIVSPGSQHLQDDLAHSWATPVDIKQATERGSQISNAFKRAQDNSINWNRVFNLMQTKYFLAVAISPTAASLSALFASLKYGNLIDQFFNCDWNISFKLIVTCLLHKWDPQQGCFNLLTDTKMRKVSDLITNSKNSLLYLMSVATLDLELFLLRDELTNNPMLKFYQECFFEDFSLVPEYLYLALINNMKHFTLLIENRSVIDEIIVTLLVQVFEKTPAVLGDLLKVLVNKDKLLPDLTRMVITRNDAPVGVFLKVLLDQRQLDSILNKFTFTETFGILPVAIAIGWNGFEEYMSSNLTRENVPTILTFLEAQVKISDANSSFQSSKIFGLPALHFLVTSLMNLSLAGATLSRFENLQYAIIIAFPRIINFGTGHDKAILANGDFSPITPDVEKEMQNYLQRMYSSEIAIKDVVEILRKLKESDDPRSQDVFACITHAVLAECSFFKDYPLEALATTSVLFGSMILFNLLNGFVLAVALTKILSFAVEGPDSKMFKFALQAIYAFRVRLNDFPKYCQDLLQQVPGLQTQTQVYQFILDASQKTSRINENSKEKNGSASIEMIPLRYFVVDNWRSPIIQETPSKDVTEKVLFIVNNLTMDNFDEKIQGLKQALTPNYATWFSGYLVNQRAKTEPNYHNLYARILVVLNSPVLNDSIINVTLRQLYRFLAAKDIQSVDKKLLKNLSLWLGAITLAIDKPIKHRNIAFRELLLEAYREQRLELTIPFVTRVLQNAVNSKIFKPPNPWTLGILQVLLELNNKSNWKLNLTFEVEVLFKQFNMSMSELEPTNFIETRDSVEVLAGNLGTMSLEQQQAEHQKQGIIMQQYQQHILLNQQRQRVVSLAEAQQRPPSFAPEGNMPAPDALFNNLVGSTIFVSHPELKRIFQMALTKAVREVLVPTVDKASNIAVVATTKIVAKDFATEVDEVQMKGAAINMVRQLAKSLARATSIDSLTESIRSAVQVLSPNLMALPGSPLDDLEIAINENIGLCLGIIEETTIDKATTEMGEQLIQAIAIRRYHKERRADQPFLDPSANPYSLSLPEPLGLKSSGVSPQQMKIYEDFGKIIPNMDNFTNGPPGPQTQGMTNQTTLLQNQKTILQNQQNVLSVQPQQPHLVIQNNQPQLQLQNQAAVPTAPTANALQAELEQNHRVLVYLMDVLVAQIKENADKQTLNDLGEQNQIKNIIFQILTFIARSPQKDQLALKVAQAVVNSLFATSESSLCREVLSLLLEKLCSLSMVARKDVVWWLVYALDSRKFDVPVIRSLLEVNLIDPAELDSVLVTAMKEEMEKSIDFVMSLLKDVVFSDEPLLLRMDFVHTLEYLGTLYNPEVKIFLESCEKETVMPVAKKTPVTETEKYFLVFTEWVKILQRVDVNDTVVLAFIQQMVDKGIISTSDSLIKFIKAALELSVLSFKQSDPTGEVFTAIDALGKLLVKLMVVQDFNEVSRADFTNMIFSVIMLIFSKDHSQNSSAFNERPYFRLLSNLFIEWSFARGRNFASITNKETRKELRNFDVEFYNIFASYLHSLQPFAFPAFCFAWVSLISHRMFLPVMLSLPKKAGWEKMLILIIDLFKFLDKYTKKDSVTDAVSVIYKGTLRIILGISNDFPEFLIENHYQLLNNLPCSYFQLKNVVLSAIPTKMCFPNPYNPTLQLSNLESCQECPSVFYDPINDLSTLKKPVDNYLRIPSNSLLRTILGSVFRSEYDVRNGVGFDFLSVDSKVVRAIVLHVGVEAGLENERTSSNAVFNPESSYYTLLYNMIHDGTAELKFQVIEVMVEQLRYPNIHTYWFNYVLLNMFTSKDFGDQIAEVQELILRCILERIIVNKPHPWGVSILTTQLLNQDEVNLLELEFIKTVPEIEKMLTLMLKHTKQRASSSDGKHVEGSGEASAATIAH